MFLFIGLVVFTTNILFVSASLNILRFVLKIWEVSKVQVSLMLLSIACLEFSSEIWVVI